MLWQWIAPDQYNAGQGASTMCITQVCSALQVHLDWIWIAFGLSTMQWYTQLAENIYVFYSLLAATTWVSWGKSLLFLRNMSGFGAFGKCNVLIIMWATAMTLPRLQNLGRCSAVVVDMNTWIKQVCQLTMPLSHINVTTHFNPSTGMVLLPICKETHVHFITVMVTVHISDEATCICHNTHAAPLLFVYIMHHTTVVDCSRPELSSSRDLYHCAQYKCALLSNAIMRGPSAAMLWYTERVYTLYCPTAAPQE